MARQVDTERKPQLLGEIMDYLLDKPLSSLTFRSMAEHLNVSTFTLVYHFGTKSTLVTEVVAEICSSRQRTLLASNLSTTSVEEYFDGLRDYWMWTLEPRNRQMRRLEIEAATGECLSPSSQSVTRRTLVAWHEIVADGLIALGVSPNVARVEARAMTSTMYGLQYDLIVTGETEQVTEAFDYAIDVYRSRTRAQLGGSA